MTNKTLKALAEAATQGEWFVHEPYTHAIVTNDFHVANAFEERDLAYIVAAHPTAILALLDQHAAEIAAKDARIKELEGWVTNGDAAYNEAADRGARNMLALAEANAKVERLREALKPFAAAARYYDDIPGVVKTHPDVRLWQQPNSKSGDLEVGHLRRARAALAGTDTPEKAGA